MMKSGNMNGKTLMRLARETTSSRSLMEEVKTRDGEVEGKPAGSLASTNGITRIVKVQKMGQKAIEEAGGDLL